MLKAFAVLLVAAALLWGLFAVLNQRPAANQSASAPNSALTQLLTTLDEQGYYRLASARDAKRHRDNLLDGGFHASSAVDEGEPNLYRYFRADGEALAEFGFAKQTETIRPFLDQVGVPTPTIQDIPAQDCSYTVLFNGDTLTVYTQQHCDDEYISYRASVVYLEALNQLLANHNIPDRAYMLYPGGEDAIIAFLTPPMHQAIVQSSIWGKQERPMSAEEGRAILDSGANVREH